MARRKAKSGTSRSNHVKLSKVVQHVWEAIRFESTERLEPVFDRHCPIRSTADLAMWHTGKPCERAARSHINFFVYDGTWEASEAFAPDRADEVAAWAQNDQLGFEGFYVHRGMVRKYRPDFLIRLIFSGMLFLEVKGRNSEQNQTKRQSLDEWLHAVNARGGLGRWSWGVSKAPADVRDIFARYVRVRDKTVAVEILWSGAKRRTEFLTGQISVPKDFDCMASAETKPCSRRTSELPSGHTCSALGSGHAGAVAE